MFEFDKTHRLIKKSDYDYVFSQAKRISTSELTLLYRDNNVGHARLGLALSKKMIAKSHDRNRVKRLIRETFRLNTNLPSVDIIVLAKRGMDKFSNTKIRDVLSGSWKKISVF